MLPPNRIERQPRASLLPGVLLCFCVILTTVSASRAMPAKRKCHAIDCVHEGREICRGGSSHCGPCRSPLEENEERKCVVKKIPYDYDKMTTIPDLDEEIDFLQSVIDKQQVVEGNQAITSSKTAPISPQTDSPRQRLQDQLMAGRSTSAPKPATSTPKPATNKSPFEGKGRGGPIATPYRSKDGLLVIMISVCILLGTVAMILATVCWFRLKREMRLVQKMDYQAYGGKPPGTANGTSVGDQTLAQSAQMYHYQHQKQQMISMAKQKQAHKVSDSEANSDVEEVEGDFTVYECPGLAPTGEMEVKNPLFDDSTLQYQRK
ncbi:neural proliferation differentiation and control protein 1a [Hypomesus transpacificus]|uniref:neural proliferation differentiation and control protein 1a n=1 Tax=Hypomesus transpacificus TaxID=137520 RepID=UPI001F07B3D7|nr:neural proliferation differentiation and control protein 1a [Hypomesus transpacificus]